MGAHDELARQLEVVVSVVDVAPFFRPAGRGRDRTFGVEESADAAGGQLVHVLERGAGIVARFIDGQLGHLRQDVTRDDGADMLRYGLHDM